MRNGICPAAGTRHHCGHGEAVASTGWTRPAVPLRQALEHLLMNSHKALVASATDKRYAAQIKRDPSAQAAQ